MFDSLPPPMPVAHDPACIVVAAAAFRIPPETLLVIRMTEGGKPGLEHKNSNGTIDYGPQQINTVNLATFHRFGVTTEQIRDHECINVYASAYLLRQHLNEHADNQWSAMMNYHSKTANHQQAYLKNLVKNYQKAVTNFAPYLQWLRAQTLAHLQGQAGVSLKPAQAVSPPSPPSASPADPSAYPYPRMTVRVAGSGINRVPGNGKK